MTAPATTDVATNGNQQQRSNLPAISGPRLPFHPLVEERFGIDRASWKALVEVIFLGATSVETVILALSYCKARKLDPFKRNVHIVPVWNKQAGCLVDTIWPGIGELRTTAFRTGEYAGRSEAVFGPDIKMKVGSKEMTFPEWAQVTVRRIVRGEVREFAGERVYWLETYATAKRNDDTPNEMWADRPRGQLGKCAEAAALRGAFPEEIGGDLANDEIRPFERTGVTVEQAPRLSREEQAKRLAAVDEAPHDPQKSMSGLSHGETVDDQGEIHQSGDADDINQDSGSDDANQATAVDWATLKAELKDATTRNHINKIRERYLKLAGDNVEACTLVNNMCDAELDGLDAKRSGGKQQTLDGQ